MFRMLHRTLVVAARYKPGSYSCAMIYDNEVYGVVKHLVDPQWTSILMLTDCIVAISLHFPPTGTLPHLTDVYHGPDKYAQRAVFEGRLVRFGPRRYSTASVKHARTRHSPSARCLLLPPSPSPALSKPVDTPHHGGSRRDFGESVSLLTMLQPVST
jgi:hypothetical protein